MAGKGQPNSPHRRSRFTADKMKENIVQKLTSKDDKYACAFTDRIVAESHDTDENLQKGQTMKKDVMIVTDAGRIGMALARRTGSLP